MTIACDAASLRKLPIFSKLDDKKLRLVAMMAERLNYHPGDYIAREGDTPEAVSLFSQAKSSFHGQHHAASCRP